tara:strand:+ start:1313 stop:1630 length:318 start_codon:yes stop_codon:yes gene_type:complete
MLRELEKSNFEKKTFFVGLMPLMLNLMTTYKRAIHSLKIRLLMRTYLFQAHYSEKSIFLWGQPEWGSIAIVAVLLTETLDLGMSLRRSKAQTELPQKKKNLLNGV